MDQARREAAFVELRPLCLSLNEATLRFRSDLGPVGNVQRGVERLHGILLDLVSKQSLDENLAEYVFFPLSQIFNQTQQLPARCIELSIACFTLLIEHGWRQKLTDMLAKQAMILMTILAGGLPGQEQRHESEELLTAAFGCIGAVCNAVRLRPAHLSVFNNMDSTAVVDQAVFLLLDGILESRSILCQVSAAAALSSLCHCITDWTILASLFPRTVSSLTKVLKPTTQVRPSFRLLVISLELLSWLLESVIGDDIILFAARRPESTTKAAEMVLDDSWVRTTASQINLALTNIIPLRTHEKIEVREALLALSVSVIENCPVSLAESVPMMVETVIVLAAAEDGNDAFVALKQMIVSFEPVKNDLKLNLHAWIIALPRVMQSNDDTVKRRAIQNISVAFRAVAETDAGSEILNETIAASLYESVTNAIQSSSKAPQPLPTSPAKVELISDGTARSNVFQPVLIDHRSQKGTLSELQNMIKNISSLDTSLVLTGSMMDKLYGSSLESSVAPFWLTLSLLRSRSENSKFLDSMLDLGEPNTQAGLTEELYSIALPILTGLPTANPEEWRIPALALEAVALQAQQLKEEFRGELIDILYPVLQLMGSSNVTLQDHAMTCLNIMTKACGYPDASAMLIENVDYLINAVGMKFNTFDISPQAPQVLLMMIQLCGLRLIPYLDDLIGSMFSILDAFHGYPKLVELLFAVLGAVVDEGAKAPGSLSIADLVHKDSNSNGQPRYVHLTVAEVMEDITIRLEKRAARKKREAETGKVLESHPKQPWKKSTDTEIPNADSEGDKGEENGDEKKPEAVPEESEEGNKALSKPHNLLISIVKSIPPHLSSPSPQLRRSLLIILSRAMAILAPHENSFLPIINDIWPSVSARITLPSILPGPSASLEIGTTSQRPSEVDQANIQEQTYVTVSSCQTVAAMCEGAGNFMSSRIEHELPKWQQIYTKCWEQVKHDLELALERHQQRQKSLPSSKKIDAETAIPGTGNGMIVPSSGSKTTMTTKTDSNPPPIPPFASKQFTPHYTIWNALAALFTNILNTVRLPSDAGDEICQCLGSWISFCYPERYFTYSWRNSNKTAISTASNKNSVPPYGGDYSLGGADVDAAIRAMANWNEDLTWLIFSLGLPPDAKSRKEATLDLARDKLTKKLEKLKEKDEDFAIDPDMEFLKIRF